MTQPRIKYSIKTRQTPKGLQFFLYLPVQSKPHGMKRARLRPVLGYNLTKEEAETEALKQIENLRLKEQQRWKPIKDRPIMLADVLPLFWKAFLAKRRVDQRRPQKLIEQHLTPFFGQVPLSTLNTEDGYSYIVHRQEQGAAAGTIRREWQVFMRILKLAVEADRLDKNRLASVELPEATKRERVAEIDELRALHASCPPPMWRAVMVALCTGFRQEKIRTLDRQWFRKAKDGYWIHLPGARSALKTHPKKFPANGLVMAACDVDVPSLTDTRIFRQWQDARAFARMWERACRRAKVHDLTFHDLRHTCMTYLQRLGVGYEVRQALQGKKVVGTTAYYSHGGPGWEQQLREAVTKLEKYLKSSKVDAGVDAGTKKRVGRR